MKFEFDSSGSTFFYFIASLLALYLVPATLHRLNSARKSKASSKENGNAAVPVAVAKSSECQCEPCRKKRADIARRHESKKGRLSVGTIILIALWILFAFCLYKANQTDVSEKIWDPYEVLRLAPGASESDVRKQYLALSRQFHPDKNRDDPDADKKFVEINKAYKTLTDEDTRKNWEQYGNPDGVSSMQQFGIALPAWIIDPKNKAVVIGAYFFCFMILLPSAVGWWWYRSKKFYSKVLVDTIPVFVYHLNGHNVEAVKLIEALSSAKEHMQIKPRRSDNADINKLLLDLPSEVKPGKANTLSATALKCKALIYAHLLRLVERLPEGPSQDLQKLLGTVKILLPAMISVCVDLILYRQQRSRSSGGQDLPKCSVMTLRKCFAFEQSMIQALPMDSSPLLQIPHFTDDILKHCNTKKRAIRKVTDFLAMDDAEKRSLMRNLSDIDFEDVQRFCDTYPCLAITVTPKVLGEKEITAGSIVTLKIRLERQHHAEYFAKRSAAPSDGNDEQETPNGISSDINTNSESDEAAGVESLGSELDGKNQKSSIPEGSDEEVVDSEDDRAWEEVQRKMKKQKKGLIKTAGVSVHCPLFPEDRHEGWWYYILSEDRQLLLSLPRKVEDLVDTTEVDIVIPAQPKPGTQKLTLMVESDSYVDCSFRVDVAFAVKAAPKEALKSHDGIGDEHDAIEDHFSHHGMEEE